MGRQIESIHGPTMEAFKNYSWPGNVRELRNVIERFLITTMGTVFRADWQSIEESATAVPSHMLEEVERTHILQVLESTRWRIRGAAGVCRDLGSKPTTLESRMIQAGHHPAKVGIVNLRYFRACTNCRPAVISRARSCGPLENAHAGLEAFLPPPKTETWLVRTLARGGRSKK